MFLTTLLVLWQLEMRVYQMVVACTFKAQQAQQAQCHYSA